MKIGRIICAAFLTVLCALGWFFQVSALSGAKRQWQAEVEEARELTERALYQRAIEHYESALSIREDSGVRRELTAAYALAYEENTISRGSYQSALESACAAYPKEEIYWAELLEFLLDGRSYQEAYKTLGRAERAGARGETLTALDRAVRYSFTEGGQYFTRFCESAAGYTTVLNGERWGVVGPDGEREYECGYSYVSPYGDGGEALFCADGEARLLDRKGMTLAILPEEPAETRAYGEGMLPVYRDGQWCYLDCERLTELPGRYEDASSYQNGRAAVCQGGVWTLVDHEGEQAAEQSFSELRLYGNGNYSYDGVFSAAADGAWGLYQNDGTALWKELSARDIGLYLGGPVAFQDGSGLWGFADREGTVVIEPRYQGAKSFSGGLAAVFDGEAWGFINREGETVIDFQFLDTGSFTRGGACPVSTMNGEFHMIVLRFPQEG